MSQSPDPRDLWTGATARHIGLVAPTFWADAIAMQIARLDDGAAAMRERRAHPDAVQPDAEPYRSMVWPLQVDAYFLVFAIRGLLAVADLYAEEDEPAVAAALSRFNGEAPGAKMIRDVLAHFDDYVRGRGRRADIGAAGQWWLPVGIDDSRNEFVLRVGTMELELRRAAVAATELAEALQVVAQRP